MQKLNYAGSAPRPTLAPEALGGIDGAGQLQAILSGSDGGGDPVHALDRPAAEGAHRRLDAVQRFAARRPRMAPGLLSQRPKGLEAANVINRTALPSEPGIFEYRLTDAGF